ncbi:hypothetical protein [Enterobacter sp. Bisph1]|uniref:hypothetical protein n=1 Tax=Enterobacter sp. Bisph1 TaxID=1274399 RepID=UPI00057C1615|nr:hypothetical protein [Enterobacter sp. Bisph1]
MPVIQKMPVPKVKHFGFYSDIYRGFADIAGEKNMPEPAKTRLYKGVVSGTAGQSGNNNLYCITEGRQEELIVTFYEQLSGTGEMVYLYDKNAPFFTANSKFLSKIDTDKPHRLFATFTGGNSLFASRAASFVREKLKPYTFQSVVWNSWSWLPQRFSFCMPKSYVIRLDLKTGDVRSFNTHHPQVERFLTRKEFLSDNRLAVRTRLQFWLREWFEEHKEYLAYKDRAIELSQKDPARYTMKLLRAIGGDNSYLLLSYEKYRGFENDMAIAADDQTEFLILLPDAEYALPKGREQEKSPVENKEAFIFEKPTTTPLQRRKVKKISVMQAPVRASAVPFHRTESVYTVEESQLFTLQRNLLTDYCGKEAKDTLSHIEVIKADLAAGRLPTKSVEHYLVADLPALSRSKGRGAWRLLIIRNQKVLTLHIIADYHDGTWKQWS